VITKKEINIIKDKVKTIFRETLIYLFGSRTDNSKRGGDIDLYVVSKLSDKLYSKQRKLKNM